MALNPRQFTEEEFCLICGGCCRFSDEKSPWLPVFSDNEIRNLQLQSKLDVEFSKNNTPILKLSQGTYFCPFLSQKDNKCRSYSLRPFDCRLYPFILARKSDNKIFLAADKKCPLIGEKLDSREFKEYCGYLKNFFLSQEAIKFVKSTQEFIPMFADDLVFISEINLNETNRA